MLDRHRFGIAYIVTAIEDTGLILWLAIIQAHIMEGLVAFITLLTFLSVEHLVTQHEATGHLSVKTVLKILGFSSLETVNWAIWLALIAINPVGAAVYFFVSFYIEHQITDNVKKGRPFLYLTRSQEGSLGLSFITLSELLGASGWIALGLSGIGLLITGSLVEHYFAQYIPY
jgi:hypothetical protein